MISVPLMKVHFTKTFKLQKVNKDIVEVIYSGEIWLFNLTGSYMSSKHVWASVNHIWWALCWSMFIYEWKPNLKQI